MLINSLMFFLWRRVFVVLKDEVATFAVALSCAEDERVVTPREDSPSDLMETELFPGEGLKAQEDKAFGMPTTALFTSLRVMRPNLRDLCNMSFHPPAIPYGVLY